MTLEKLNQKREKIDQKIMSLKQEKEEIDKEIEELTNQEDEEETKIIKEPNNSPFIPILMSIMSFIGILVGIIYVIYSKKGGIE